ncbi:membrane magnesium transporter family protein [Aspergillus aculeatinus CBS 121060]|uniref:Uncharacterized protein n=1 Tax=Aspergillus aculeatinus CBS 121060 TaxID=1448322 RepID=A0ACD1GXZ4_9EURO|nr:hypothetical protein BO66DRAFT_189797 [Aspergillus aculeatinus CBS 121060]RAH66192.1 hypothetical protein BO66DRAFT_189797 [Aspergillus aculeatinus CBS 121060]
MGFFSRLLTLFGLVLLAHASRLNPLHSTTTTTTTTHLPPDIIIEALVSLIVVSMGLVLGTEKLKPISWSEWAGQIEREGKGRHPYRRLEERYGFWDVRAKRKEFADWIRGTDLGDVVEEVEKK